MAHKSTTKIAVGLVATVAIFLIWTSTAGALGFDARPAFDVASAALLKSYEAAPALMLVTALAASVLLLIGTIAATRAVSDIVLSKTSAVDGQDERRDAEGLELSGADQGQPYLDVQIGNRGQRCALFGDMLRIGREDDNDIRIPSDAVERYHAAIHREDYDDWHITEIGGRSGAGLIVNGRRCGEARLQDGDIIQLGPGRLRFHAAFA